MLLSIGAIKISNLSRLLKESSTFAVELQIIIVIMRRECSQPAAK